MCLLLLGFALYEIGNSRSFQFFGEIIPRVNTEQKVVALTFDDGPTTHTPEVLQILKDKNVKATFFVVGSDLEKNPGIGKDIVEAGHELGNHSYSHERMWLKSSDFYQKEVESTNNLIKATGYSGAIHFRPPYGKKLFGLPWYLSKNNIKTIMWDVEPDSYASSSHKLVEYAVNNTKPGSIILLHPFCGSCGEQRESIGYIIEQLEAKGYRFVTVSELLSQDAQ